MMFAAMHESGFGTFRTCHDFRVESAFGSKAEVRALSLPRAASGAKRPFKRKQRRVTDRISIRSQSSLIGFGDNGVSRLTDKVIEAKAYQLAQSP